MLNGKKVLLGVTGGIAAYKTTYLTRLLIKAGAEVRVVLSPSARDFVTPLSLSTLSKNPVYWEYFDKKEGTGQWNNHVELALWADLMIIAPLTANTMAKMAIAQSDNFLMAVYLSAKCPVFFAPAMDLDMYRHPANQENISKLESFGHVLIPAEEGELASGLEGKGRMAEPETIVQAVVNYLHLKAPLAGRKVLINGGPTYEAIDPVRFIGNRSSGKMGIALADAAADYGADVTLILGPTHLSPVNPAVKTTRVESAREMLKACEGAFLEADLAILSAAISDYRPANPASHKMKKTGDSLTIALVENPDVLFTLGQKKKETQLLVGFALETNNALEYAKQKLHKKNCDWIVLNQPGEKGTGFEHDTNEVIMIRRNGEEFPLTLKSKTDLAYEILDTLLKHDAFWIKPQIAGA